MAKIGSGSGKHPRVVKFLASYRRLVEATDNDPANVAETAKSDPDLMSICFDLEGIVRDLFCLEKKSRMQFARNVDPTFIKCYRDFKVRYAASINEVLFADADLADLLDEFAKSAVSTNDNHDHAAMCQFRCIPSNSPDEAANQLRKTIEYAEFRADFHEIGDDEDLDFLVADAIAGISVWTCLTKEIGLDIEGILRRREMVSFIQIPEHVSNKYGDSELPSLMSYLAQAHESFVYGIPIAALALMRSILELLLTKHYKAGTTDDTEVNLCTKIKAVSPPQGVSRDQLHRLRKLTNDILHISPDAKLPY